MISGLGLLIFLLIAGLAFWVLLFLMGFILPTWLTLGFFEWIRPKKVFEDNPSETNSTEKE